MLVVYSSRTGRIRRIISDEVQSDAELLTNHPVGVGESVELGLAPQNSIAELQAVLSVITGLIPSNDRYVTLNNRFVVDHIFRGDPDAGDGIGRKTSFASDTALIDHRRRRDGTFDRSLREIDADIAGIDATLVSIASQEFIDNRTTSGLTTAEIDTLRTRVENDANTALVALNIERARRTGPR